MDTIDLRVYEGRPATGMNRSSRAASWLAVADAVGHCLLVFAFVPTLTVLPRWLWFELTNPLNLHEPIVLAFVLVRGFKAMLDAFADGVVAGVVSGSIDGVLMWAVAASGAALTPRAKQYAVGAATGAVASGLMIVVVAVAQGAAGQARVWGASAIAFELAAGLVCGAIAAPTAVRLLRAAER